MTLPQSGNYKIITYGCQMNVHESERLAGILVDMGYTPCRRAEDADIVVFNTCCIRETAEQKAQGNIGALKKLKKSRPEMLIAVCGCMTQSDGSAKKLVEKFPFIDIVFGTHNLHEFSRLILSRQETGKRIVEVWEKEDGIPPPADYIRDGEVNAWVNITYGCNNFCTYCIVPYVRGRERSRPPEDIINEVKALIDSGYKEITLLGQNVNSYGNDMGKEGNDFPALLKSLATIPGKYRLKFMTSHPKDFSHDLIEVIAKYPNISKAIHLPVQSGSTRILGLMNRGYTAAQYMEKLYALKNAVPKYGITTDIMVGFPKETKEDFEETLQLVKQAGFSSCYSFVFSRRKGTPADGMQGQIDGAEKKRRIMQLISVQNQITTEINKTRYAGKIYEVLVDGKLDKNKNIYCGRTDCGRLISFTSEVPIVGKFVNVRIDDAVSLTSASLSGIIVP